MKRYVLVESDTEMNSLFVWQLEKLPWHDNIGRFIYAMIMDTCGIAINDQELAQLIHARTTTKKNLEQAAVLMGVRNPDQNRIHDKDCPQQLPGCYECDCDPEWCLAHSDVPALKVEALSAMDEAGISDEVGNEPGYKEESK